MSQTKVQLVSNIVGNVSGGASFTGIVTASSGFSGNVTGNATGLSGTPNLSVGVVTATSFVGNVTGTASTATAAGTAYGLTGTPNLSVGVVTATSFSGNINSSGVSTFTNGPLFIGSGTSTSTASQRLQVTGGAYVSGNTGIGTTNPSTTLQVQGSSSASDTRLQSVCEETTLINGNTASLVYNTGGGNVAICTNASGDITLAVTGIPTDSTFNNNSITFSVFSLNTGVARSCTAVTLNGFNATIRWAGGSLASASSGLTTTTGMDIYSFTGINTVGSASTTANYYVLGVVNGGYR